MQGLEETGSKAEKTQGKLGKAFDKIGSAAVACGKVIATGLAVGTAAFGTLTTKAMNLAGELEQNMGGAEAVFGEYASKMEETAKSAFSSMGLSASDFLGTANKMGSLFKGAGFEAGEAADLTASAMQRAADVASIMGIDVSVAMESIAGAAKGNFTMMDNLGVAMNDTNLQAYALSKGIEKTTQQMTSQEKIGLAMQMFMEKTADYAGNYAKENETLAGSLTTAKAALSNFLSGIGDANEVATALASTGKVISQKLLGLLPALVTGLSTLFNALIPELPPLISSLLPAVLDGAVGLIEGVVSAAGTLVRTLMDGVLPKLGKAAMQIMESLGSALIDNIEFILDSALQIAEMLAMGLLDALPKIADAACTIVEKLGLWIEENAEFVIESGINLISKLASTLAREIPHLIQTAAKAVAKALPALLKSFSALWTQFDSGLAIVTGLLIAFKGFAIVTKVISLVKSLKTAMLGLNAVMNANPIGLLVSGFGLLIASVGALSANQNELYKSTHKLSDEFKELQEDIDAAREATAEMKEEYARNAYAIEEETQRTEDLWKELQTLADETGYVTDANKDRASYLLSELNEALGTEYEMNGNIIGQYQQMQDEIDTLIQKRRAERLFENYGKMYDEAQTNLTDKKAALNDAETELANYKANLAQTRAAYNNYASKLTGYGVSLDLRAEDFATNPVAFLDAVDDIYNYVPEHIAQGIRDEGIQMYEDMMAAYSPEHEKQYEDAIANATAEYLDAERTMQRYNDADYAMATGKYEEAAELLLDGAAAYWNALEEGKDVTTEQREALAQSLKQDEAALMAYHEGLKQGDPLLNWDRFGKMLDDFGEKVDLLGGDYTYQNAQIASLTAEELEFKPVMLSDESVGAIKDLRAEIARLAEAVGLVNSDVSIKINNREFGRLVKAGVK